MACSKLYAAARVLQVKGLKSVTLVPPSQLAYMYPYPGTSTHARRAQVDITRRDLTRFPLASMLQPLQVTLQPGDMLFVPRRSGHETVAKSDSTTVTFRLQLWCS